MREFLWVLQDALWAGLLASIACGVIGAFVLAKRIASLSGSISHASFGGIGLGYFLGINPLWGALFFALASALGMGALTRRTKLPADTVIAIFWAVGMALGIVFVSLTPGYVPDLLSYLFGNILFVTPHDLLFLCLLDAVVLLAVALFFKELLAVSFDEEFSKAAGVPAEAFYLLLLCLVALTVVALIKVVGVIMVIALLTLPAAVGQKFAASFKQLILLAVALGTGFTFLGLGASYLLNWPPGATIVLLAGAAFLFSCLLP